MRMRILGLLTRKGRLRFKRYRSIFSTLMAYGFHEIVYQTGTGKVLRLVSRVFGRAVPRRARYVVRANTWERIRMVAEELGPTFIKLGPILSNRPDLGHSIGRRLHTSTGTLAGDFAELLQNVPADSYNVVDTISSGRVRLSLDEESIGQVRQSLFKASSSLVFAIVLGSLIVGSAIIVHSKVPPLWHEVPVIGIGGFVISGVIGFGVLINIIRNRGL